MNFVFLSIFVCVFIAKADPISILQPIKQMSLLEKFKADPKAFVSQLSEADPQVLRQILTLLDGLLTTSENREGELVDNLNQKQSALNDANGRVVAAQGVLDQALLDQTAADAAVIAATADVAAQTVEQNQAIIERDDAQQEHDSEIDSLNDEQAVLRQVIDILTNLLGQQQQPTESNNQCRLSDDKCASIITDWDTCYDAALTFTSTGDMLGTITIEGKAYKSGLDSGGWLNENTKYGGWMQPKGPSDNSYPAYQKNTFMPGCHIQKGRHSGGDYYEIVMNYAGSPVTTQSGAEPGRQGKFICCD